MPSLARGRIGAYPAVMEHATARFRVTGMSCDGCAQRLTRVLQQTPGVEKANVNFAEGRCVVQHDPAAAPRDLLIQRVESAGFHASDDPM